MKKIILTASVTILTFCLAGESWAECVGATETTAGTDTITGAHCGICGTNCNWKIEGDTLKVTGGANGEIGHMNGGAKHINDVYTYIMPWKDLKSEFSKVDISGVENVGEAAFRGFTNITDIKLGDTITKINGYAFTKTKVKTLILPDSVTTIGLHAFSWDTYQGDTGLEQVLIPDTLVKLSPAVFSMNPEQLLNINIICRGNINKCKEVMAGHAYCSVTNCESGGALSLAGNVVPADYTNCVSTNYFWNGDSCIREPDITKRKCCDSCKDVGGWCNRIRYTPAEAAEVLHDDNTNEVTITFRK